jgi:large subunit ribosomal protein L15
MKLHELHPAPGSHRDKKRIGRGLGSGKGTTAGKGQKGQKARSGGGVPPYFEGGQLPLVRRLPYRRGFKNPFRVAFRAINVGALAELPANSEVTTARLIELGLLRKGEGPVKLLGDGEVHVALRVSVERVSQQARAKIEAAGGSVTETLARREKKDRRPKGTPKAEESAE